MLDGVVIEKKEFMMFKIDFENAYDYVEWGLVGYDNGKDGLLV